MSINATGMYLIPAWSWRQAQRRPSDRFTIGLEVVEESVIEFWDRQHPLSAFPKPPPPRVDSDFMSIHATGTYLIPACSWRRVQQPLSVRFRIGCVVVEEYYVGCPGIWMLRVMMREQFVASRMRLSAGKPWWTMPRNTQGYPWGEHLSVVNHDEQWFWGMSLDGQEVELLCLICQDGMSCIGFVQDA